MKAVLLIVGMLAFVAGVIHQDGILVVVGISGCVAGASMIKPDKGDSYGS